MIRCWAVFTILWIGTVGWFVVDAWRNDPWRIVSIDGRPVGVAEGLPWLSSAEVAAVPAALLIAGLVIKSVLSGFRS